MSAGAKRAVKATPAVRERAARELRAQPLECAACAAAQDAVAALLRRVAEDGEAADALNWRGICNAHAWRVAEQPAAARRLAAVRLRADMERLATAEAAGQGRRSRRGDAPAFGPDGDCPFCAATTAAALAALEQHMRDGADAAALWCLPHLCAALGLVRGRERIRAAAQGAVDYFSALEADLSELIRKSDYRFRGEPRGKEASSWLRAARLVAGGPVVRWPLRREPRLEG